MADARHKRKYPPGERKQMTPAWKKAVIDRLEELKMDKAELARLIGADKSIMTKLLTTQHASALVPSICAVLKLDPPMQAIALEKSDEDRVIESLSAEEKRLVANFVNHVIRKIPS